MENSIAIINLNVLCNIHNNNHYTLLLYRIFDIIMLGEPDIKI